MFFAFHILNSSFHILNYKILLRESVYLCTAMNKEDLFYLGKITKTVSFKGELAIYLDVDEPENYFGLESVIVEIKNTLVPYFLEQFQFSRDQHFKARFMGVDTEEQAKALVNCELYLPLNQLPKLEGNKFYFHEVIGFEVVSEADGSLGKIQRVIDLPANPLFEVIHESSAEILVPMTDEVIQEVDRVNGKITVELPEGLLDLYL